MVGFVTTPGAIQGILMGNLHTCGWTVTLSHERRLQIKCCELLASHHCVSFPIQSNYKLLSACMALYALPFNDKKSKNELSVFDNEMSFPLCTTCSLLIIINTSCFVY